MLETFKAKSVCPSFMSNSWFLIRESSTKINLKLFYVLFVFLLFSEYFKVADLTLSISAAQVNGSGFGVNLLITISIIL